MSLCDLFSLHFSHNCSLHRGCWSKQRVKAGHAVDDQSWFISLDHKQAKDELNIKANYHHRCPLAADKVCGEMTGAFPVVFK